MRTVYKVLAYAVAIEVAIQAMAMVYAVAGLGKWVSEGNTFDQSLIESEGEPPFPEVLGFIVHGINGGLIIPAIALALLIVSFFAKVSRGVVLAVAVFGLVAVQTMLGYGGHGIPALGALHGLNALLLFTTALYAARSARPAPVESAPAADTRVSTAA
ncbi:MAG: hypothetical protein HOV79_09650 [Hamadaea sp.]|nr:hypothetical protein [Hamadaea sp.]